MKILNERKKVIIPQGVIHKKGLSTKDLSWTTPSYGLECIILNLVSLYDSKGATLITRVTDD